ncbi:hypothetical protein Daus18300_008418 [Diaporthe australafricana]|uniref:Ankyrin repeat protein n=1 Tax=Diaporthe australafricana TaxID=127596 RepID=A0ABR3WIH0_9PEZI
MEEFQKILKRFTETLQKKKVFSRLGIPLRDPLDFDLEYVLSIASKISEWRDKSEDVNACVRFARKCWQKATKNKDVLSGLISLTPTDTYGSLISGGFTFVLAAMESHEKLRLDMEKSLARIPKELSKIERLSNVYIKRDELHKHADHVLVSIFTVLERIIDRLSRTWKENFSIKFKDNASKDQGGTVEEALQTLTDSISDFNEEAKVCAQLRLGRMEETGQAVKFIAESMSEAVKGTSSKVIDLETKLKEICDSQQILLEERRHLVGFLNQLYPFVASNPAFNAVDGTVNRKYLTSTEAADNESRNKELTDQWFNKLDGFEPSSQDHIKKFIENSETFTPKEQDKAQYIMGSQPFQEWLEKPKSSLLCVRAETAPEETFNAISLSTAMLALTLQGSTRFAVLSFFCSLRRKDSREGSDSGALGVIKSLNGQLLRFMADRHPRVKLSFEQDERIWKQSVDKLKHSCALFRGLMSLLPAGSVVFILLDSVSRTSGDKYIMDELVNKIVRVGRRNPEIVVKLLVTDPVPGSQIRGMADDCLYVPDDVDLGERGMNMKRSFQDLADLREEV